MFSGGKFRKSLLLSDIGTIRKIGKIRNRTTRQKMTRRTTLEVFEATLSMIDHTIRLMSWRPRRRMTITSTNVPTSKSSPRADANPQFSLST